jgi:hypothetical protein
LKTKKKTQTVRWMPIPFPSLNNFGWVVMRPEQSDILQASKPGRVSHSVNIGATESQHEALQRLYLHVCEGYPTDLEIGEKAKGGNCGG